MNIDSIQNGIVLDHITAGKGMLVYKYLGLDKLDCSVAIIKNATSHKMGRKDILKIDHPDYDINLDILGYVDPEISVSIIKDGVTVEKKKVGLITIDTYRIGAIEQLKTYAEIMNIQFKVVITIKEM